MFLSRGDRDIGVVPTQGSNLGLPHYRQTLYRLSHQVGTKVNQAVLLAVLSDLHCSTGIVEP